MRDIAKLGLAWVSLVMLGAAGVDPQVLSAPTSGKAIENNTPAAQQPTAQTASPQKPEPAKAPPPSPGMQLFRALLFESETEAEMIADQLRRQIVARGMTCDRLSDYQIYKSETGVRFVKVKCREQPLIRVQVTSEGAITLSGGDGTVPDMFVGDGLIKSFYGERAEEYLRAQSRAAEKANQLPEQQAPVIIAVEEPEGTGSLLGRFGLPLLVLLNIVIVSLALLAWWTSRRHSIALSGWRGLTSHEKDYLIEESHEELPGFFRHPSGMYIVRGARGKRRVFSIKALAYLYQRTGLRIGAVD